MCCDPMVHKSDLIGITIEKCPDCGNDVDVDGNTVELNSCCYSPVACETCNYKPCDGSC